MLGSSSLWQISSLQKQNHPCRVGSWAQAGLTPTRAPISTKNQKLESPGVPGHREHADAPVQPKSTFRKESNTKSPQNSVLPVEILMVVTPLAAMQAVVMLTLISLKTSCWNLTQTPCWNLTQTFKNKCYLWEYQINLELEAKSKIYPEEQAGVGRSCPHWNTWRR